jgi:hypothetical protein
VINSQSINADLEAHINQIRTLKAKKELLQKQIEESCRTLNSHFYSQNINLQ